jgi:hypothetical protein
MDVCPISDTNKKIWQFLNGRLRVGGESAKLADIANQKIDRADIGPIKCVTWVVGNNVIQHRYASTLDKCSLRAFYNHSFVVGNKGNLFCIF